MIACLALQAEAVLGIGARVTGIGIYRRFLAPRSRIGNITHVPSRSEQPASLGMELQMAVMGTPTVYNASE